MIRCVVFDLGQVLSSPATLYTEPAELLGVDPAAYEARYWVGRREYDTGRSAASYWGPLLDHLGVPATPERIQAASALDTRLWIEGMRPEALQLVRDVRAAGTLVAILSNAPFALDLALADAPYADAADFWFVSASMGVAKPDPTAYYRVEEVTEVPASGLAFIDDRPDNVHGARAVGWQAHLFVSDADTREWLRSLEVL